MPPQASSIIRRLVAEHYGVRGMPMSVLKREDEILAYEADHPEVPPFLWEFVRHDIRLLRMWSRADMNVDIVVWDPTTSSYRLVQDLCFRDAYASVQEWYDAVNQLVKESAEVWVATHGDELYEDDHP